MTEWDRILPEKACSPEEPDETVVDFAGFLHRSNKLRVLDLACGGGRHTVRMVREGFEVTGVDISRTGLEIARKRLDARDVTVALVRSVMNALPFAGSSFDAVICTRAIHHQSLTAIQLTLVEMGRVLEKTGPYSSISCQKEPIATEKALRLRMILSSRQMVMRKA